MCSGRHHRDPGPESQASGHEPAEELPGARPLHHRPGGARSGRQERRLHNQRGAAQGRGDVPAQDRQGGALRHQGDGRLHRGHREEEGGGGGRGWRGRGGDRGGERARRHQEDCVQVSNCVVPGYMKIIISLERALQDWVSGQDATSLRGPP